MSFGFFVGDCVLLLQIARSQYKNCVAAGPNTSRSPVLRNEAEKKDGPLLRNDAASKLELVSATEGCQQILEDLQTVLIRYEGLSGDGEAVSATKKLWHRIRFSTKIQALGEATGRLEDTTERLEEKAGIQLKATGRIEDKLEEMSNMMSTFLNMKNAIVEEVLKARLQPRGTSTASLLSLSTYNEDDKEVWQEFRRELVAKGFKSKQLDRHKDMLEAYLLKLEECGVLDHLNLPGIEERPWWMKHVFFETTNTLLPGMEPIVEEKKDFSVLPEYQEVPATPKAGIDSQNSAGPARSTFSPRPGRPVPANGDAIRQTAGGLADGSRARPSLRAMQAGAAVAGLYENPPKALGSNNGVSSLDPGPASTRAQTGAPRGDDLGSEFIKRGLATVGVPTIPEEERNHNKPPPTSLELPSEKPPVTRNMSDLGPASQQRPQLPVQRSSTEADKHKGRTPEFASPEVTEDGSGAKVVKGTLPKKFAYAESLAESEPEQQGPEPETERADLVLKTNTEAKQSPRTSDRNLVHLCR